MRQLESGVSLYFGMRYADWKNLNSRNVQKIRLRTKVAIAPIRLSLKGWQRLD
jgi:hypothetical protein